MVERKVNLQARGRIPVQVPIFLLNSEILISHGTNYNVVSSNQFDLKHKNKKIMKLVRRSFDDKQGPDFDDLKIL